MLKKNPDTGIKSNTKTAMIELLNARLADAIDLALITKQAHWNLKGPTFIAVHEFLDEVEAFERRHLVSVGVEPGGQVPDEGVNPRVASRRLHLSDEALVSRDAQREQRNVRQVERVHCWPLASAAESATCGSSVDASTTSSASVASRCLV